MAQNKDVWKSLADALGVKITKKEQIFGMHKGYLLSMGKATADNASFYYILLRYSSRVSKEIIEKAVKENNELKKEKVEVLEDGLFLRKFYTLKQPSPETIRVILETLLKFLEPYNLKFEEPICEVCNNNPVKEIVLVNDTMPALYCLKCIEKIKMEEEDIEREYDRMPVNYHNAAVFGTLAAIIGAGVWAVVAFLTKRIFGLLALGIGFIVSFAVGKGAGKTDRTVQAFGIVLTMISVFLGELFYIGYLLYQKTHMVVIKQIIELYIFVVKKDLPTFIFTLVFAIAGAVVSAGYLEKPKIKSKMTTE